MRFGGSLGRRGNSLLDDLSTEKLGFHYVLSLRGSRPPIPGCSTNVCFLGATPSSIISTHSSFEGDSTGPYRCYGQTSALNQSLGEFNLVPGLLLDSAQHFPR